MLERKDIKNGNLVFNEDVNTYHIIEDVGDAREKGDRGNIGFGDELSYGIINVLNGEKEDGICEHSGMTSTFLSVATKTDVDIYLAKLEAEAMITLGMAKKHINLINNAINRLSKLK